MTGRYLLILLLALLLGVLFYPTLYDIALICWNDDDYSHGLVLPFVIGYILYIRRAELGNAIKLTTTYYPLSLAVFSLLLGSVLFLVGEVGNSLYLRWVSLFFVLVGLAGAVLPRSVLKLSLAPVLLLFMAKPIPDSLTPRLFNPFQTLAARLSARVLELLDVPVFLQGNRIEIPNMALLVEEACSGMRSLMTLLTVALIVIFLVPMTRVRQVFFIGLAIVLAITLNIIRVAATGVLAYFWNPAIASGFLHTFSGLVVFVVGLVILYWVADRFEPRGVTGGSDVS